MSACARVPRRRSTPMGSSATPSAPPDGVGRSRDASPTVLWYAAADAGQRHDALPVARGAGRHAGGAGELDVALPGSAGDGMIGAVALAFALATLTATVAQLAADGTATLTSRFWAGDGR